jgi:hypothetical protein
MWEQTHIICFETTIYRGEYETGASLYGSMYRVLKYKSLIYCEFKRVNGKVKMTSISVDDKDNTVEVVESDIQYRPLDIYYVPISKTTIDEIKMNFKIGSPEKLSILNYVSSFKGMAADLEANIGKDYAKNLEVLKKYMVESAAEKSALEFTNKYTDGYKYSNWSEILVDDNFGIVLMCEKRLKKNAPIELKTNIHFLQVELINGKYYLKYELNL